MTTSGRLGRNVLVLSGVSLLTDVSSEMTYPLLPLFLTGVLGAGATTLGAIEGAAESVAALLKLASGWLSDRASRRKPLVVAGYGLASAVRPLIGLAQTAAQVLAIRLTDRVGKGIRTSPRDALIADSVDPRIRGRAFGFHRAADNLGAVIGPLIAWVLLRFGGGVDLRRVFLLTAIPAVLAMALLVLGVREKGRREGPLGWGAAEGGTRTDLAGEKAGARSEPSDGLAPSGNEGGSPEPRRDPGKPWTQGSKGGAPPASGARLAGGEGLARGVALGGRFWALLGVLFVFTLGNSSDAFMLLRASRLGVAPALVPILWALLNLVKAVSSTPGGALSDRVGRRPPLVAGWLIYAAVYFAFGRAGEQWQVWALFAAYGLYFGLTEGVQNAFVADFVPAARRGAAYGWYNLAIGLGALPASLLFGFLSDRAGAPAAFTFGAAMALLAALAILFVTPPTPARGPEAAGS